MPVRVFISPGSDERNVMLAAAVPVWNAIFATSWLDSRWNGIASGYDTDRDQMVVNSNRYKAQKTELYGEPPPDLVFSIEYD